MIIVFYDGQCGLCQKEIRYYQSIAPDHLFDWQDITVNKKVLEEVGISYDKALRLFHAQDASGQIYIGVDAFILIWRQLPKWRILAMFVSLPLVKQLTNLAYQWFAAWRFKRQGYCQLS